MSIKKEYKKRMRKAHLKEWKVKLKSLSLTITTGMSKAWKGGYNVGWSDRGMWEKHGDVDTPMVHRRDEKEEQK